MENGWISLHRKIQENEFYPRKRPYTEYEAWLELLLDANHKDRTVILGKEAYICKRGQLLRSQRELSLKWNWSQGKVRRTLALFQKRHMIILKPEQKATRITICNYDNYQDEWHTNGSQTDRKRYTNNNSNNVNNVNNKSPEPEKIPAGLKDDFIELIIQEFQSVYPDYVVTTPGKERKMAGQLVGIWKKRHPGLSSEETLASMRRLFERCRSINDNWLRDNMSLATIVAKYNTIMNKLNDIKRVRPDQQDLSEQNYNQKPYEV